MLEKQKIKMKLTILDLDIIAEALVESENVVNILGDDKYIARHNYLSDYVADEMIKFYKTEEKSKKWRYRWMKVKLGQWV